MHYMEHLRGDQPTNAPVMTSDSRGRQRVNAQYAFVEAVDFEPISDLQRKKDRQNKEIQKMMAQRFGPCG